MPRKVVLIADPGIDTSFAIALALHDPNLNVLGIVPTAGNVSAAQATLNVQILLDHLDPPKRPRTATALPADYDRDGTAVHGPDGLGGVGFAFVERHSSHTAEKLLAELVREHPHEISLICLGPTTAVAHAFDLDPELIGLIDQLVLVGGSWKVPGNAGPCSEFHFALDPESTRKLLHLGVHPTIIPLDVTQKLIYSPKELLELPNPASQTGKFLRAIVPFAIRASSNIDGIEGFHLKDVLGVAALALPGSVRTAPHIVEIEAKGEFTRGMMVVDDRKAAVGRPNVQLAVEAAVGEIRQYVTRMLAAAN